MIEIPEANVRAATEYDKTLRLMKRRGIKVEHLSQEAAESMLYLHQNALLVYMLKKRNADMSTQLPAGWTKNTPRIRTLVELQSGDEKLPKDTQLRIIVENDQGVRGVAAPCLRLLL